MFNCDIVFHLNGVWRSKPSVFYKRKTNIKGNLLKKGNTPTMHTTFAL